MTKLQREKYLLALSDGQRLALLLALGNLLQHTDQLAQAAFDDMLTAYRTKEKEE